MQQAEAAVTTEINSKDKTIGIEITVKKQTDAQINKKMLKLKDFEPETNNKIEKVIEI